MTINANFPFNQILTIHDFYSVSFYMYFIVYCIYHLYNPLIDEHWFQAKYCVKSEQYKNKYKQYIYLYLHWTAVFSLYIESVSI